MNKQERESIQKWIEDTEEEIKCLEKVRKFYQDDPEMRSYFDGMQCGLEDNLATFEYFLNGWKKCKSE